VRAYVIVRVRPCSSTVKVIGVWGRSKEQRIENRSVESRHIIYPGFDGVDSTRWRRVMRRASALT
jgi:hypothetical protein